MATIEQLIEALLPLLPDAEVTLDNDGEVIIRTGLTAPPEPARLEDNECQDAHSVATTKQKPADSWARNVPAGVLSCVRPSRRSSEPIQQTPTTNRRPAILNDGTVQRHPMLA